MRWSVGKIRGSAICLAIICISGCAPVGEAQLRNEVSRLIAGDRYADRAMAHLEKAGFICTVGDPANVECSRTRNTKVIITCIQRVILVDARLKNEFSGADFPQVACFSGFG